MLVPEFDLEDESTWTVITAPPVDASFLEGLKEIGGLNPLGKPMLQLVWGATHVDPQSADGDLKYFLCDSPPVLRGFEFKMDGETHRVKSLAEVPLTVLIAEPRYESEQLGQRRFIVEEWHSPEFLAKSGRYMETHDTGESELTISCRNCGGGMKPTGREDERVCVVCGSKRQSVVEFREIKNERLLKDIPREGVYDHFFTIQTKQGLYHPADAEALEGVRRLWEWRKRSFKERSRDIKAGRQMAATRTRQARREIWHPDNLLKKEEEIQCQPL
jgi:hypothetical protein